MDLTPPVATACRTLSVVAQILEGLQALMQDTRAALPAPTAGVDPGDNTCPCFSTFPV